MRLRFHLQSGVNYRKWQIRSGRSVRYFDPDLVTLLLYGCRLVTKLPKARRVHAAGVKDVCGWVEFEGYVLLDPSVVDGEVLRYNPIVSPHWHLGDAVVDGECYDYLVTNGRKVVIPCPT